MNHSDSMTAPASQVDLDVSGDLPAGRWWRKPGDRPVVFNTVSRKLRAQAHGQLLDVGCGQGQFARRASRYFDVHGVDVSPPRVARARLQSGLDTITMGSATALEFPDASFDVVCALDVVEHLEEPSVFLAEARRVLRAPGLLLFSTPNPTSLGRRVKGHRSYMYSDPTHVSLLPPSEWRRWVREGGFSIVRDGTDLLWDPPYVPVVPASVQRVVFLALAQLLFLVDFVFPGLSARTPGAFAKVEARADSGRRS